jgi:hypothetical protein
MTATALTLALEALKTEQSLRLGYTHGAHGRLESTADAAIAALTAAIAQAGEPFGYFRAEPFGWTNCAETDEGAIALYEHPANDAALPEIDYMALIEAAFKNHGHAQGSRGCVAFKHGAEWFRAQAHAARAAGEGM